VEQAFLDSCGNPSCFDRQQQKAIAAHAKVTYLEKWLLPSKRRSYAEWIQSVITSTGRADLDDARLGLRVPQKPKVKCGQRCSSRTTGACKKPKTLDKWRFQAVWFTFQGDWSSREIRQTGEREETRLCWKGSQHKSGWTPSWLGAIFHWFALYASNWQKVNSSPRRFYV